MFQNTQFTQRKSLRYSIVKLNFVLQQNENIKGQMFSHLNNFVFLFEITWQWITFTLMIQFLQFNVISVTRVLKFGKIFGPSKLLDNGKREISPSVENYTIKRNTCLNNRKKNQGEHEIKLKIKALYCYL